MTTLSFRRRRTTRSARLWSCNGDTDRRRRWPMARSARESLDPPTTAYPTLPRVFGRGGPAHRAGLHAGQYHTSSPEARARRASMSHPRGDGSLHTPATIRDPRSCGGTRAGVHGETGLGVAHKPMPYPGQSLWPVGPTRGEAALWGVQERGRARPPHRPGLGGGRLRLRREAALRGLSSGTGAGAAALECRPTRRPGLALGRCGSDTLY